MKTSKTTVAGTTAATCYAVSQVPGLPEWLTISFRCGAAISIAMLGIHATDCPPNCPGTDSRGRILPPKSVLTIPILALLFLIVIVIVESGCTTPNPEAGQGDPPAPAYIVDPQINSASNTAHALATTADQVTGTGGLWQLAIAGIFAAAAGISGLYARHRSAVASSMADAVATAGPAVSTHVIDETATGPQGPAVRQAVVDARRRQITEPTTPG